MQGQAVVPEEKIQQIQRGYKVVESYLTNTKWIASNDRMTVADIAIFAWMESFTQVFTIEKYPKLTAWLNEMRKLPYYKEANKTGADLHIQIFRGALEKNKKAAA
jgi:glutathione S-transferase